MQTRARRTAAAWHRAYVLGICFSGLHAAGLCLEVADAQAAEETGNEEQPVSEALVSVQPFTGVRAKKIQERVSSALAEAGINLYRTETPIALGSDDQGQPNEVVGIAHERSIKAFIKGEVNMSKEGWDLALSVVNGKDGSSFDTVHLMDSWLPGLLKKVDQQSASLLEDQLAESQVPTDVVPPGAAETERAPEPTRTASKTLEALRLGVGAGLVGRDYAYSDPISDAFLQTLAPHTAAPFAINLKTEWYPGAHFTAGAAANIGLTASFTHSFFGVTSAPAAQSELSLSRDKWTDTLATTVQELNLGLRARFPLNLGEVGVGLGWGRQSLVLSGDNEQILLADGATVGAARGLLPDVQYEYLRAGLDGVLVLGAFAVRPGVFVRVVTDLLNDPGYIAEQRWFPDASSNAIEATLGFDYLLGDNFAIVADGTLVRYGIDTNFNASVATPDETTGLPTSSLAGGASDLYFTAFFGAKFKLGGTESLTDSNASER